MTSSWSEYPELYLARYPDCTPGCIGFASADDPLSGIDGLEFRGLDKNGLGGSIITYSGQSYIDNRLRTGGTNRPLEPGRCLAADGITDFVERTITSPTDYPVSLLVRFTPATVTGLHLIAGIQKDANDYIAVGHTNTAVRMYRETAGVGDIPAIPGMTAAIGTTQDLVITMLDGETMRYGFRSHDGVEWDAWTTGEVAIGTDRAIPSGMTTFRAGKGYAYLFEGDLLRAAYSDTDVGVPAGEMDDMLPTTTDSANAVTFLFEECASISATVYDSSGNGLHGTLTGSAAHMGDTGNGVRMSANEDGFYTDGSECIAIDLSDRTVDAAGNALTYTGQAPQDAAVYTPVATFGGTNEWVYAADRITTGEVTKLSVGIWIETTSVANQVFMGEIGASGQYGWYLMQQSNYLRWGGSFNGLSGGFRIQRSVGTGLLANQGWKHFVATYDGSQAQADQVKLYLQGIEISATEFDAYDLTKIFNTTAPFAIGAQDVGGTPSNKVNGSLSNAVVHDGTAWTPAQVWDLYDSNTVPSGAHWIPLCEGNGTDGSNLSHLYKSDGTYETLTWAGNTTTIWAETDGPINTCEQGVLASIYSGADICENTSPSGTCGDFEMRCRFRTTMTTGYAVLMGARVWGVGQGACIFFHSSLGYVQGTINNSDPGGIIQCTSQDWRDGEWHYVVFKRVGSTVTLTCDTDVATPVVNTDTWALDRITLGGAAYYNGLYYTGEVRDAYFEFNDETVGYYQDGNLTDFSGNSNDLTVRVGSTPETFPIAAYSSDTSDTPAGDVTHDGVLYDSQSLDFSPVADSPYDQRLLATALAVTTYVVGDDDQPGGGTEVILARVRDIGDDRFVVSLPATSDAEILSWTA